MDIPKIDIWYFLKLSRQVMDEEGAITPTGIYLYIFKNNSLSLSSQMYNLEIGNI